MKREAEFLRSRGDVARYTVEKGRPHRLETMAGEHAGRFFKGCDEARKGAVRNRRRVEPIGCRQAKAERNAY